MLRSSECWREKGHNRGLWGTRAVPPGATKCKSVSVSSGTPGRARRGASGGDNEGVGDLVTSNQLEYNKRKNTRDREQTKGERNKTKESSDKSSLDQCSEPSSVCLIKVLSPQAFTVLRAWLPHMHVMWRYTPPGDSIGAVTWRQRNLIHAATQKRDARGLRHHGMTGHGTLERQFTRKCRCCCPGRTWRP